VTHLLALVELPTFLQELYETRRCRTPQYLYKLRSLSEERPDLVRDRVREASRIDAAFVNGLNEEIKGPRPVPVAPPPSPTNSVAGKVIEAAPTDPGATKSSERVRQANKKGQPKSDAVADHVPDPVVRATYRRRPVSLVLSLKPSAKGHVFVQHAGGLCEQVAFEQLQKLYVAEG
jgi:ParB family chromosome partitioning protein